MRWCRGDVMRSGWDGLIEGISRVAEAIGCGSDARVRC